MRLPPVNVSRLYNGVVAAPTDSWFLDACDTAEESWPESGLEREHEGLLRFVSAADKQASEGSSEW